MEAWIMFCNVNVRAPLPLTEKHGEEHALASVGWLKEERRAGRRRAESSSIPQYLSCARMMENMYRMQPAPALPFVDISLRAYRKWEEKTFPVKKSLMRSIRRHAAKVMAFGNSTRMHSHSTRLHGYGFHVLFERTTP